LLRRTGFGNRQTIVIGGIGVSLKRERNKSLEAERYAELIHQSSVSVTPPFPFDFLSPDKIDGYTY